MTDILTDFSTPALARAVKSNLFEYFRYIAASKNAEAFDAPELFRWCSNLTHPWFNGVLCKRIETSADIQRLIEQAPYFQSKSLSGFNCWPPLEFAVETWKSRFEAYGFHYDSNTPGMAIALDTLQPVQHHSPDLQIELVTNKEQLRLWTRTFVKGFELPPSVEDELFALISELDLDWPNRSYIGTLRGEPVATSNVFLGAGVAGIQYVSTVEEARRQGFGAAMTLAPLHDARRLGYKIGILQSSDMGQKVYERIGFQQVCRMEHFYYANQITT